MVAQVDHLEVAPRMWDKSIAASYTPSKKDKQSEGEDHEVVEVSSVEGGKVAAAAATLVSENVSFFTRFKAYIMPALFVICLIVVVYILWKYFTKYKNKHETTPVINASDMSAVDDPMGILESEDLHKYELDSDDDQSDTQSLVATKNKSKSNLIRSNSKFLSPPFTNTK